MRRRQFFAFSLAVLLGFGFLATSYSRGESNDAYLTTSVTSLSPVVHTEFSDLFNQSTRMQIYNLIKTDPGIYFREICDRLGLSIGNVQYHLDLLERKGIVATKQDGRYKRYFEAEKYSEAEMQMISFLKHPMTARILLALHVNPQTHKELTEILGISSQALSWQMNRLKSSGLVQGIAYNLSIRYFLTLESENLIKIACSHLRGS